MAVLLENTVFQDITYYHQNKELLRSKYCGRYILIKDEKVIGNFCTWSEASTTGLQLFNSDNFFIKYCK